MKKFGDEAFFSLISGQRYFFIIFENLKTFWFCDFFRSGEGGNSGLKWNKIKTESKMVKIFFRKMLTTRLSSFYFYLHNNKSANFM